MTKPVTSTYRAKFYDLNGAIKTVDVPAGNHVAARLMVVDRPDFWKWHTHPWYQAGEQQLRPHWWTKVLNVCIFILVIITVMVMTGIFIYLASEE